MDNDKLMDNIEKEIQRLNKEMNKLSYKIPRFFKALWYNIITRKPHPPYGDCKDIKSVIIVFENCEVAEIPREYIWVSFGDIKYSIGMCSNAVLQFNTAQRTDISIDKEYADTHYSSFYFDDYKTTITDRLMNYKDVVSLYLNYNDKTEEKIYVYWSGNDDFVNPVQQVKINSDRLNVAIEKKGKK